MYIRDINDDYLKLLQIAMCHTLDSVGIVSANISQGICLSFAGRRDELECQSEESIDTYIQRVSEMIPMPESFLPGVLSAKYVEAVYRGYGGFIYGSSIFLFGRTTAMCSSY